MDLNLAPVGGTPHAIQSA